MPIKKIITVCILVLKSICTTFAQTDSLSELTQAAAHDSLKLEEQRSEGINRYHAREFDKALVYLETYYRHDSNDSITKNILADIFIKKLSIQKSGDTNFKQLITWANKYPFIKKDEKLRKIKVIESLRLGMAAFDARNYMLAEQFYNIIEEEITQSTEKKDLLALNNLHALIFNLGLKHFLDRDYRSATKLFEVGIKRYPSDPEMAKMYHKAKSKISY
ncbi:hypothetical protein [Sphingobacterium griseoflavum]|uniref:Tetratricopeptide repeat protein n=1 Tax=Sphingobacterium griseoflavum TaxID=1474952 RepID=A0ABQ3HSD2_9SPHI|nr:hypothetical protein [Sphingobacterium griseoflavum]GHE23129.1 hypothetical protein GCM10017764_00970 [Sphingobacterium griseoflavum]